MLPICAYTISQSQMQGEPFYALAEEGAITQSDWIGTKELLDRAVDAFSNLAEETAFHQLRIEYTNIFLGMPKPAVSPYESIHRGALENRPALLMVDEAAVEVAASYKAAGLKNLNPHEPADHMALELEFMGVLASSDQTEALRLFFLEHFNVWAESFCCGVEKSTEEASFYMIVGRMLLLLQQGIISSFPNNAGAK